MYKINDVVVYGCSKVCSIKEIGIPDFITKSDKYYQLQPVGDNATILYVKVENSRSMRNIMSRPQADALVLHLPDIDGLYNRSNKVRDREYDQVMKSRDSLEWFRMWKGITMEKLRKSAENKRLNASDEGNLKRVEDCISSELSVVYNITKDEVKSRINQYIKAPSDAVIV